MILSYLNGKTIINQLISNLKIMANQEQLLSNILEAFSKAGKEIDHNLIFDLLKNNSSENDSDSFIDSDKIKKLAEEISTSGKYNFHSEISRRNLSRWFEIPEEEYKDTPKEQLEPEVLIRHIILENKFKKWLEDWDYEVSIGEDLEGVENIEFIPDLYARRITLHGIFEIVICFVCDNPPSIYRVRALFEAFESFAREGSDFGNKDILILVTPHTFGRSITQSISLQNQEERYTVVGLEGNDISILDSISDPGKRLLELKEHVEKAQVKSQKERKC
jgi:hypothetical protein